MYSHPSDILIAKLPFEIILRIRDFLFKDIKDKQFALKHTIKFPRQTYYSIFSLGPCDCIIYKFKTPDHEWEIVYDDELDLTVVRHKYKDIKTNFYKGFIYPKIKPV